MANAKSTQAEVNIHPSEARTGGSGPYSDAARDRAGSPFGRPPLDQAEAGAAGGGEGLREPRPTIWVRWRQQDNRMPPLLLR